MMLTGVAMSPAIRSRYPWYVKFWGGHQGARSLHFLGMVMMCGFIIVHVCLVFLVHREHNVVHMVFGDVDTGRAAQAITILVAVIVAVVAFSISSATGRSPTAAGRSASRSPSPSSGAGSSSTG